MSVFSHRSRNSFYIIPSTTQTGPKGGKRYMVNFSPFRNTMSFSLPSDIVISRRITGLILLKKPLTIFRRIITVVVNTINRIFRRGWFTYIFKKWFKNCFSLRTNLYPSTTIVFIAMIVFIIAAIPYFQPRFVNFSLGFSMSSIEGSNLFVTETTTTLSIFNTQTVGPNSLNSATITPAQTFSWRQELEDNQSPKPLPNLKIFFPHFDLRIKDTALIG